jgi:acetyltransferase-like isoleucine patch superfamily enzyme
MRLLEFVAREIFSANSKLYVSYLRKKGVTIGGGTHGMGLKGIDLTRPCLVEIGRNCIISQNAIMLTHDVFSILREKYGEVLCSSGKVVIGDNCFIGANAIILKGVRIGRNTIIAPGSVVTRDIPANSVAAGNPCRVIKSIDEYYEKRKRIYVEEAKAYAFELYRKTGKVPKKEDFWEEFPLFLDREPVNWGKLPVRKQCGSALPNFLKSKPLYKSFEEFLIDAGIPRNEIEKR